MLGNKENNKLILRYVLPSICAMVVSFFYNVVDGMFVGKGVGENALAAVNLAVPFTEIMTALASMLTIGGATIMAIRKGRGENEKANDAFMISVFLLSIVALFLTVVGTAFPRQVAKAFGATELLLDGTATYIRWYSLFSLFFTISILGCAFLRNDGSPGLAFWGMVSGAVANIFLDWLFVFPLQMGLKGAAIASGLGQILSCAVMSVHFLKKRGILRFRKVRVEADLCRKVFTRGLPEFVIQMSQPITIFWYNRVILKNMGEAGLAAFSAATYLLLIVLGVFFGISQGLQPLIGNCYGENKTADVGYFFRAGLKINLAMSCFLYIVYLVVGKAALSLFVTEPEVAATALKALKGYGLSFIPASINIIYITYFFSTKNTARALIVSCSRGVAINSFCVMAIPAVFGVDAIWHPMFVAETATMLIAYIVKLRYDDAGAAVKPRLALKRRYAVEESR